MRRAQRWMLGGLVIGLAGFAVVATDDALHGPFYHADVPVNDAVSWMQANGWPAHAAGNALTQLGNAWTVTAVVAVAAVAMWVAHQRALAAWAVGIALATTLAVAVLKDIFQRARPAVAVAHGYSFPSGHTLAATAALGSTILLATEAYRRRRGPGPHRLTPRRLWAGSLALAAVVSGLTGIGRVLAQQHWLSDVVASWCLGLALAGGLLLGLSRAAAGGEQGPRAPPSAPPPSP